MSDNAFMLRRWAALSNITEAEASLEPAVAALGTRYRVQKPFWGLSVFADFALLDHKVIFEVDGKEHQTKARKAKDAERTAKLEAAGWRVFRCTNEAALKDPDGAVRLMLGQAGLSHLLKD